jgi:c-di-GMP-binding flagellar brake protein YcgR
MKEKSISKSSVSFYGSKEGNDISVLLECRAVVEKADFVSTGLLTYAQGEIIEIEIPEYDVFQLKEPVKIILYTKNGMFVFESTIIAKEEGSLIIINPPENRKKFVDKREYPRVDIDKGGLLSSIHDRQKGLKQALEQPIPVAVNNISMSGAGFLLDYELGLNPGMELAIELDLGFPLACKSEIVRKNKTESGYFYGTRFISVAADSRNALRAFVLRSQVEMYYVQKRINQQKAFAENATKPAVNY